MATPDVAVVDHWYAATVDPATRDGPEPEHRRACPLLETVATALLEDGAASGSVWGVGSTATPLSER